MMKLKLRYSSLARLVATSFALGAGITYFFDKRSGGRRRALLRDQAIHLRNMLNLTLRRDFRFAQNRARGLVHDAKGLLAREPVADDVLVERVRSRLGHVYSHARDIEVNAKGNGLIELRGSVHADEKPKVVMALRSVPGVRAIDDDLDVRTSVAPQ